MTVKFYVDPSLMLPEGSAGKPIELVAAHLDVQTNPEKRAQYGTMLTEFERVSDFSQADISVVPYVLNFCVEADLLDAVFKQADRAHQVGKRLLLWATSDQCLDRRYHRPGLMTLSEMGFASRRALYEFCAPWFAPDAVNLYRDGELPIRQKRAKPVVGFCGQAVVTPSRLAWQTVLNSRRIFSSYLRRTPYAPSFLLPGIVLRSRVLNLLEKDERIETDFILRTSYKAGLRKDKAQREDRFHPTRVEFIENIFNTDYTICVRGGGNWSMRLYEALSCGRIPIFINTDCILPFDFSINWRDYVVWVEDYEIPHVAEKLADFHASLSPDEFIERQKACRALWVDYLSRDGFFAHLDEHLSATTQNPATPSTASMRKA